MSSAALGSAGSTRRRAASQCELTARRRVLGIVFQNRKDCTSRMSVTITLERADTADAVMLITELENILAPNYPIESRHGLSVERLIAEAVAFFVIHSDGTPAGCGGIKLFGAEYGELKRMYVRPQFRGA